MERFFKIRIVIDSTEEEKLYYNINGDNYLGDFLRNYDDGKYASKLTGDKLKIKISENDMFRDLFTAPDATLDQICEGFTVRSIQYEICTKTETKNVESNSRNAFSLLMNRQPSLLPPRDQKLQNGPKQLWNTIVDWIESHTNARFQNDEYKIMMDFTNTVYNTLWLDPLRFLIFIFL